MLTRRNFARRLGVAAAGASVFTEAAFAQRAAVGGSVPEDAAWLNANENPDGPPKASIEAAMSMLPKAGRYHYQQFREFYATVGQSEGLEASQVLVGAGSSEILHAAVDAFTGPDRPLIHIHPTYEGPISVATALGRKSIPVPLNANHAADVKRLVEEADKARGGIIYLCNPNNPTSAITPKQDIGWLIANLPPNTVALIDEAYIHLSTAPELESAIAYVKQGKNVVVSRTFSKIYGMAGLRVGFGCAPPNLIRQMEPFRDNVVSIVSARAVAAALNEAQTIIPDRRARYGKIRSDLCAWLRQKSLKYIEPHANFVMIDVGRDVRTMLPVMAAKGVVTGRPFPPLDHMMRVSIGTESDMDKFRRVFWEVYSS